MKAFVMAAGFGERVQPLSEIRPKPLFPVGNRPILDHLLSRLASFGIREAAINLHYRGEEIRRFCGSGKKWGMRLLYSQEEKLLGTAGGVKKMERFLRGGTFLVCSGDGLWDLNLADAIRFHRRKRSRATMLLHPVEMGAGGRCEYGLVLLHRDGRIRRFLEKPLWSEAPPGPKLANVGIYILEPEVLDWIPRGRPYDFGRDLWPWMLRAGVRIFGFPAKGYWCDIGDPHVYRRACREALEGKIRLKIPGRRVRPGVWIGGKCRISRSARLSPPCAIGPGCRIGPAARIGPYTTLGAACRIGRDTVLSEAVVWDRVRIGGVALHNGVLTGYNSSP